MLSAAVLADGAREAEAASPLLNVELDVVSR